jgi:hypothetical protein
VRGSAALTAATNPPRTARLRQRSEQNRRREFRATNPVPQITQARSIVNLSRLMRFLSTASEN